MRPSRGISGDTSFSVNVKIVVQCLILSLLNELFPVISKTVVAKVGEVESDSTTSHRAVAFRGTSRSALRRPSSWLHSLKRRNKIAHYTFIPGVRQVYPCRSYCVQLAKTCANNVVEWQELCRSIDCPPTDEECMPGPYQQARELDRGIRVSMSVHDLGLGMMR